MEKLFLQTMFECQLGLVRVVGRNVIILSTQVQIRKRHVGPLTSILLLLLQILLLIGLVP
jgi:hypothetical protein